MGLAVDNALKYQQAESTATTDYMTGLPNARSLFLRLEQELARCKREYSSLTVMVCDMDGFKQVNDRFGHLEGNRVLQLFSHALKQTCRNYDYVSRLGGDEFVVIAPGLSSEAVQKKAEDLRDLAQQAGREVCRENIISLSVGWSSCPEDGVDAEGLLTAADRRMYMQKRNQSPPRDRRRYPRLRSCISIELQPLGSEIPIPVTLTNINFGGCYLEIAGVILAEYSEVKLAFDAGLCAEGTVVRIDSGAGVAIQFREPNQLLSILHFVESINAHGKRSIAMPVHDQSASARK
jgi:diguanylate cyclase (GGDEF)-like protein